MKHGDFYERLTEKEILEALHEAAIEVSQTQAELLAAHANKVLEANAIINLTAITDRRLFLQLHVVDSVLPMRFVDVVSDVVLDLGTGAGFPGIPLAIMGCHVLLCEATKKKADLLALWVEELGVTARVVRGRAEEVALSGTQAGTVIARAVAPLAALAELASPLLPIGGRLVAMKSRPADEEIAQGDRVAQIVGMRRVGVHQYSVDNGTRIRSLYVYEKTEQSHVRLPRRPGLAQKRPLRGEGVQPDAMIRILRRSALR